MIKDSEIKSEINMVSCWIYDCILRDAINKELKLGKTTCKVPIYTLDEFRVAKKSTSHMDNEPIYDYYLRTGFKPLYND